MQLTSAEVSKILSKLQDEYESIKNKENASSTFLACLGEDVESVRPEYDYEATQKALSDLETKIRKIKHALNIFNATTVIPKFGITIDEMLVYMPQLTARLKKLKTMSMAMPKVRYNSRYGSRYDGGSSAIIDYQYANYDIAAVKADYDAAAEELSKAQLALDTINHTAVLEIDI